jgi:hypothetical protein
MARAVWDMAQLCDHNVDATDNAGGKQNKFTGNTEIREHEAPRDKSFAVELRHISHDRDRRAAT